MDKATLAAYDRDAASYATEWTEQPAPTDLYELLTKHFVPGPTADVGCGAGRDTAWLAAHGFDARGYDASEGLLAEARRRYPQIRFDKASLPDLAGVPERAFANVTCETVIMHLAPGEVALSVRRLVSLLAPGGTLYLSWRVTRGEDLRDKAGRLYAAFDPGQVLTALASARILMDDERESLSSGKIVRRIVACIPSA
jgi:2-polyprenyl-3-methyl-5-hydroxy-6-metoxy-1,4-benzoquinol methylase